MTSNLMFFLCIIIHLEQEDNRFLSNCLICPLFLHFEMLMKCISLCNLQTISYMAERVVGSGSFGVVFQVIGVVVFSFLFL